MEEDTMKEEHVIEVEGASYSYGDTEAVRDVSLSVEPGEFLGLIGPNGSGKTTLLKLMIGLLEPDSGSVRLFGAPPGENSSGGRVGYVSQQSSDRGDAMPVTVEEAVSMGRYAHSGHGRLREEDRRAVDDAIQEVGVGDLRGRRLSELSGGQRQRTYIARALAAEAELLALDEPAVGVDSESCDAFYGMLDSLNDEGITVILIEHDVGVVTEHADRIACMNQRLYHHGDTESFVESDALAEAYGEDSRVMGHHHHD